MRILRALLTAACLLVFVLPAPALAAPALPPTFYLPAVAEVPPGFAVTRVSAVGTSFRGGQEQQQNFSAPAIQAYGWSHVLVYTTRAQAVDGMAGGRRAMVAAGRTPIAMTVGDESYAMITRGMYTDFFEFYVRSGLVSTDTTLFLPAGVSEENAATIGYALMAPTLQRMKDHPDGV